MLLYNEWRRSDVGKQDALRKSELQHIKHIPTVMDNDAETTESGNDSCL